MGIRFRCPNCDKRLNVKAHQAGHVGICPHCRGEITVPETSTLEPDLVTTRKKGASENSGVAPPTEDTFTLNQSYGDDGSDDSFALSAGALATPPGSDSFLLSKPSNPALRPGAPDPIDDDPRRIWYVRHPKFSEVGPVRGDKVREMLDNGRIIASCRVWREDWNDWERAADVFSELKEEPASESPAVFRDPNAQIPASAARQIPVKRRQSHRVPSSIDHCRRQKVPVLQPSVCPPR